MKNSVFYNNFYFPYKYDKKDVFINMFLAAVQAVLPTVKIFLLSYLIDNSVKYINNTGTINAMLLSIIGFVFITLCESIFLLLEKFFNARIEKRLLTDFMPDFTRKRASLKYVLLESKDVSELYNRISDNLVENIMSGYKAIGKMINIVIQILCFSIVLIMNIGWLSLFVLVLLAIATNVGFKNGNKKYTSEKKAGIYKLESDFWERVLTDREYSNERILYRYKPFAYKKWESNFNPAGRLAEKTTASWMISSKKISIMMLFFIISAIYFLLNRVYKGSVSIGTFIAIAQASFSLADMMSWDFADQVNTLSAKKSFIKDILLFFSLDGNENYLSKQDTSVDFNSLEFKHVYFKYPNCDKYTLKDINFVIKKGEHCAIVGANGAGKSTILKLIYGLYDNYEGEILINGKSIVNYSSAQLKGLFHILFQDYGHYELSLKENLFFDTLLTSDDKKRMNELLNAFDLQYLLDVNQKEEINLGKSFENGVELSGGQWQKISIIRAIISKSPVKVLDEPTASLDPASESKLYNIFQNICEENTSILISHRLGATVKSDIILIIDDGKIVERGNYAELMKNKGIYYRMFESQRQWYND